VRKKIQFFAQLPIQPRAANASKYTDVHYTVQKCLYAQKIASCEALYNFENMYCM